MPVDFSKQIAASDNSLATLLEPLKRAALSVYFPETDQYGNPNLSRFFLENGRLPFVGDPVKPWRYRGWLIPYLQMAEAHPMVCPRYDYVLRTIDAGRLLNEPIPHIDFVGEFEQQTKAGLKMLNKCLETVEYKSGSWNGMREFCEWLGFALGVTTETSKLEPDVQEFLYRNFNLEPLLLWPSDYLGQMLCETNHGKRNGFYPTPIHVCEAMARMTFFGADAGGNSAEDGGTLDRIKNPPDQRHKSTLDCCVGTGRMLLVASNYSMRLYGQDIDYLCVLITKINLALYAPWFYLPESFFPEKEEKPVIDLEIEPEPATEPQPTTAPAPFDLTDYQQKSTRKKKAGAKVHNTNIEQPGLFDFD